MTYLRYDSKSMSNQRKIDQMDFTNIKNYYVLKSIIEKVKRQSPE